MGLKCLELNDKNISNLERSIGILTMLFGRDVALNCMYGDDPDMGKFFMSKATIYLQRGIDVQEQKQRKEDISLVKDLKYIVTSIETQYHLNVREREIHFWHFIDLIEGLHDTLINRIRDIRNADLKDYKDLKQKRAVIDLKNHYALNVKIEKPKSLAELLEEIEKERG